MARKLVLIIVVSSIIFAGFQQGGFAKEKATGKKDLPTRPMAD
jgi:hypothetical protein